MALQFAKAKCLFNYLATMNSSSTKSEKWARFFFKQIVTALAHMHQKEVAHLDLKIDNVLLDFDLETGKLTALVADFGMAQPTSDPKDVKVGYSYGPPELIYYNKKTFDLEKADVFASAFILLALVARARLGDGEQCMTDNYRIMLKNGGKSEKLWPNLGVQPTAEFQDLFERMACFYPEKRIGFAGILEHPWMVKDDLPTPYEVASEVQRISQFIQDKLVGWRTKAIYHSLKANPSTIKTLEAAAEEDGSRGLFDNDDEIVEWEDNEEYELILNDLAEEERTFQDYQPELFEWTQFPLDQAFEPIEVFARIKYIQKHVEDKEQLNLYSFTLSEDGKMSATIEQLTPIPYPALAIEELEETAEYLEAKRRLAEASVPKVLPSFEVRLLRNAEDESIILQAKLIKGDVIDFQEIYRKIVRIMNVKSSAV